jgi:hypothetical protein
MKQFVDIALLREYMDDNSKGAPLNANQDMVWSDEDLQSALDSVAREYNSTPPFIGSICDSSRLSAHTNAFLDGAGSFAIERWLRRKQRERTSFEAGGITTDPDGSLIDSMGKLAADMRERFITAIRMMKANRNQLEGYRRVG